MTRTVRGDSSRSRDVRMACCPRQPESAVSSVARRQTIMRHGRLKPNGAWYPQAVIGYAPDLSIDAVARHESQGNIGHRIDNLDSQLAAKQFLDRMADHFGPPPHRQSGRR